MSRDRSPLILAGVASALLAFVGGMVWTRRPPPAPPHSNDRTHMVEGATASPAAVESTPGEPTPSSTARSQPVPPGPLSEPVTFLDSARNAGAAYKTGNFESARLGYEQSLAKHPDDPDTLSNLAQVLVHLGRVDEALALLERAVALAPASWAPRFNLAHAAGQLGQWQRAVSDYREAARLFPTDYATQFNLAMALHKTGDERAAIPEFRKAIELAPGEASFHVALGNSLEAVGRVNDAVAEFTRYLDMAPSAADAPALRTHVNALVAAQAPSSPPS